MKVELKQFIKGAWCPKDTNVIINRDLPADHYKNNSLVLECSEDSKIICIDFDIEPNTQRPEFTKAWVDEVIDFENDWICYSSKYTIDDLKTGKCRFKVFYYFKGDGFARNKNNSERASIDVLYFKSGGRNKWVKFAGARGKDEFENVFINFDKPLRKLPVDPNDYLPYKCRIKFDNVIFRDMDSNGTKQNDIDFGFDNSNVTSLEVEDLVEFKEVAKERVSENEFRDILSHIGIDVPPITATDTLLKFPCLFMEKHSNVSGANGYAFKRDGYYIARCQGVVCSTSYDDLNKKLKLFSVNRDYNLDCAFDDINDYTTVFKAPTGWGKTENIAKYILNNINNENGKLLVIMPDISIMERLIGRVNHYSGGQVDILLDSGKIFMYTSENSLLDFEDKVLRSNVIISHHHYFKNCGQIFTKFKKSEYILGLDNLEIVIDEMHAFIELITRNILEVGGLYVEERFNQNLSFKKNRRKLINNYPTFNSFLTANRGMYSFKTDCVAVTKNDYGTVQLKKDYNLNPQVEYLDVVKSIKDEYVLCETLKDENMVFEYYKNNDVIEMKNNEFGDDLHVLDLLLKPAEYCILAYNVGDSYAREQMGNVTALFYQNQLLAEILQHKCILMSATVSDYHLLEISKINPNYNYIKISANIDKVDNLVILSTNDSNARRVRKEKLEFIQSLSVNSLVYLSTIDACKRALHYLPYAELNDNGYHTYIKHDVTDFGTGKYMTLAGLESSVSKGYNFMTEIDGDGFALMYFDTAPVSPKIIKMFVKDGKLKDFNFDYQLNVFAQAIGRAFRKNKGNLTLCFNRVEKSTVAEIKEYLAYNTSANIVEADLTNINIKISLEKYIDGCGGLEEVKNMHRNNQLFKDLYLIGDDDEDESEK